MGSKAADEPQPGGPGVNIGGKYLLSIESESHRLTRK
jgi:hypothetical protein